MATAQSKKSPVPATPAPTRLRLNQMFSVLDAPRLLPLDALDADPVQLGDPDRQFLGRVISCLQNKDRIRAIKTAEEHRTLHPRNAAVLNLLAALHLQNLDGLSAEKILQQAMRLSPDDNKIANNLACSHMLRKSWKSAETILKAQLSKNKPAFAEMYYNLALCQFSQNNLDEALAALVKGRQLDPLPAIYVLFSRIAYLRGDLDAGSQLLLEGMTKHPNNTLLQFYTAGFLMLQGKWNEAVATALSATLAEPDNRHYAGLYSSIIQYVAFDKLSPGHADAICNAAYNPGVNCSYLERGWTSLFGYLPVWSDALKRADTLDKNSTKTLIYTLKADKLLNLPFICAGLSRIIIRNREIELLMGAIRTHYTQHVAAGGTLDNIDQDFLAALSCQLQHNEYVYFVSESEQADIQKIRERLKENSSDLNAFLILCTHFPLRDFVTEDEALCLRDDPRFAPLVQFQIINRRREFEIMEALPQLTPIDDEISRLVEQMYIENPYPVWLGLNYGGDLDYLNLAPNPKDRIQVLIAGCGTGQHALMAALTFQNLQITAIDLSKRSLAYAQRMTEECGVPNVTYAHADILGLGVLKQKFDSIESVGVLHHMKDPIKGLNVLLGLLKPKGYLRLGLYSEIARVAMVAGREAVAAKGYESTLGGIRQFRHAVMHSSESDPTNFLNTRGDFYTVSTCRDLVFHVQEHRYTIPQVKQILIDHNLVFRGFSLDLIVMEDFRKTYPGADSELNLDYWHEFEINNPSTFSNMYQFWAQKAD